MGGKPLRIVIVNAMEVPPSMNVAFAMLIRRMIAFKIVMMNGVGVLFLMNVEFVVALGLFLIVGVITKFFIVGI